MTNKSDKRILEKRYVEAIKCPDIHCFEYARGIKELAQLCWDGSLRNGLKDLSFLNQFFREAGRTMTAGAPCDHGYERQENRRDFLKYLESIKEVIADTILVPDSNYRWGTYYAPTDDFLAYLPYLKKEKYEAVVPVLNGGFFIGSLTAKSLGIENILPIKMSRYMHRNENEQSLLPGFKYNFKNLKVLIVDDIRSFGRVEEEVEDLVKKLGPKRVDFIAGRDI